MQTSDVAQRISAASHGTQVKEIGASNVIVLDDWRLRGFVTDAGAPAWAVPTSDFSLTSSSDGDYISKSGTRWDYGYQDLGYNTPVTLPDNVTTDSSYVSSVGVIGVSTGRDLVCFYANNFRNRTMVAGIYVVTCYDDGAGNLWWSQPTTVFESVPIADTNQQSQKFVTFPRIQIINNEYWILALECSREVNVITYHVCYFHSADGVHWSRREYLAGVSSDPDEASVGINQHDSGTAFTLADLQHAYLSVSTSKVYMISKAGSKFSCAPTSLVGVTNANKQLDLTADVVSWDYDRPTSPGMVQTRYSIQNTGKKYDSEDLLVADARIVHKAGYVTTGGDETITLATNWADEIRFSKQVDNKTYKDVVQITAGDSMMHLRDFADDQPYEFYSPAQSTFDSFCDLTAIGVVGGRFVIGYAGGGTDLTADVLDPNSQTDESLGYVPQIARPDGSIEFQFQFTSSVNLALTAAGVFQGIDNRQFYSIAYWVVYGKWVIARAIPTASGNKIYTYYVFYQGSTQSLSPDTNYWLKVMQYHNHVMAWTSSDRITWTNVINYQSVSSEPIPASHAYWGLLGHSHGTPSGAIGNGNANGGKVAMDSSGNPKYWALKVTTTTAGILNAIGGMFTQTGLPPDLTIGLAKDNGSGTAPADITNYTNVVYSVSTPAIWYSTSDAPVWRFPPVPHGVYLSASTIYWIYVTFNAALSAGQTWEWYGDGSGSGGTTMSSTNGSSWSSVSGNSMAAFLTMTQSAQLTKFNNLYWTSGEDQHTIEDLAKHIAAKAHILNYSVDSFVTNANLSGGWQPTSYGTLGDFVMDADVDATGGAAEVYFRATTNGDNTTGYKVVVNSTMSIYWQNTLKCSIGSMQTIPTTYHLRVVCQTNWIYIWVNEALACTFYAADATVPGYFGVGVATFTNLRIPDMTFIKGYHLIDTNKPMLDCLRDLVNKTRYKFFVRYDGSLRIGSFSRRVVEDTYSNTIKSTDTVKTNRNALNQIQPTGNYWAQRFMASLLDKVGWRRYKQYDYTDAYSNEDAYLAGKNQLKISEEQADPLTMVVPAANFSAEPEDRITNTIDSTDYIIDSYHINYERKSAKAQGTFNLRKFIS